MLGTRTAARVAAGLAVGLVVTCGLAPVATASPDTLAPDTAVVLATPGVVLTTPHDGRIRGYEFSAQVTGAAFAYTAGAGYDTVSAPAGDYLCVFSLSVTDFDENDGAGASIPDFAALAVVGDRTIPLDVSSVSGGGSVTYAVAVPRKAPVSLELSGQDLTQGYSLSRLALEPPVPAVLYRDPAAPHVSLDLADNTNVAVSSSDGSLSGSVPLDLDGASLSYFSPDANLTPPGGPGDAFLVLDLSSPDDGDITADSTQGQISLSDFTTLTPGEVSLVLPGGTTIPAQHTGPTSLPWGDIGDSGLIEGSYYFVVPADIATAEVVVDPRPNQVAGTYGVDTGTITVDIAKTTFPLSFPPPVAIGPPGPALSIPAAPAAARIPFTGGGSWPWPLIALAVLIGALVLVGYDRWRPIRTLDRWVRRRPTYGAWRPEAPPLISRDRSILYVRYEFRAVGPDVVVASPGVIDLRSGPTPWALPPAPPPERLVIRLLGPLGIEGLVGKPPPRLLLILAALALSHPEPVGSEELRNLLGSDYFEKGRRSLANDISRLRHFLPPGVLPRAQGSDGYRLVGDVSVDWAEFRRLAREARMASGSERHRLQAEALRLVEGVPLAYVNCNGLSGRGVGLAEAVEDLAIELAEAALSAGEPEVAEFATERGLRAQPQSGKLWELRFRAGLAGSSLGVHGVWATAQRMLGEKGAERLRPYYERLRAGT